MPRLLSSDGNGRSAGHNTKDRSKEDEIVDDIGKWSSTCKDLI